MTKNSNINSPEIYVQENMGTLLEIIKHSDDTFTRSLCLAAIVKFGNDPDIDQLKDEIDRIDELETKLR